MFIRGWCYTHRGYKKYLQIPRVQIGLQSLCWTHGRIAQGTAHALIIIYDIPFRVAEGVRARTYKRASWICVWWFLSAD